MQPVERLAHLEDLYALRKRELHGNLVLSVEKQFADSNFGLIDSRVKEALMRVRRHRHIALDYYLSLDHAWKVLDMAYSNMTPCLDPYEASDRVGDELLARDIDPNGLSRADWKRIIEILFPDFFSTASAPIVVAAATQMLLPDSNATQGHRLRALDVGAGLGYQSAFLRSVGFTEVQAIEIKPYLVSRMNDILAGEGYDGIVTHVGDGSVGLPSEAPFDAIVVGASVRQPEVIAALGHQLTVGGRLVVPEVVSGRPPTTHEIAGGSFVERHDEQMLRVYVRRSEDDFLRADIFPVQFVELQSTKVESSTGGG